MERTFPEDVASREELRVFLLEFCEEVAFGLRDKGLRGRTITLKARYAGFRTVTRTKTLDYPTNLGPRIYAVARELLERVEPGPLRLIGVQVSGLEDVRVPVQHALFDGATADAAQAREKNGSRLQKLERAQAGLDKLRRKYGRSAVVPASLIGRGYEKGRDGSDGRRAAE